MKTIYIHGSFESNNFGDYLLYKLAIDAIKEYGNKNNIEIDIISDNVSELYQQLYKIKTFSAINAIKKCDAVVFAGGGYFGEPGKNVKGWNKHFIKSHALPLLLSKINRKPVAVVGVGAGPISNRFIRKVIKSTLKNARVISVRDIESKDFLNNLRIDNINVHPDWVLSTDFDKLINKVGRHEDSKSFFIHVTGTSQEKLDVFCESLKKIRLKYPEINYIFGTDNTKEKQRETAKYIMERIGTINDELFIYNDPYKLLQILLRCKYIITDKLHVGICGVRMSKSVISLPIHPKIVRFYRQINYEDKYVIEFDKITEEKLVKCISSIIDEQYVADINQFIRDSDNNKKLLLAFLDSSLNIL